jgi:hypothetical protein
MRKKNQQASLELPEQRKRNIGEADDSSPEGEVRVERIKLREIDRT